MKGEDVVYELPVTLQEIVSGTTKAISLRHGGKTETVNVKIPKGMVSGKRIRLAGKGDPGRFGGPDGDMYIQASLVKGEYLVNVMAPDATESEIAAFILAGSKDHERDVDALVVEQAGEMPMYAALEDLAVIGEDDQLVRPRTNCRYHRTIPNWRRSAS